MYASEHRSHGDPTQPYVAMTTPEAVALSGTLRALREHLAGRLAWTLAQRMVPAAIRDRDAAILRAQLATLTEFCEAHDEAHRLQPDNKGN
jgi:hypothetical protein